MLEALATVCAGLFAGAALYITLFEHHGSQSAAFAILELS